MAEGWTSVLLIKKRGQHLLLLQILVLWLIMHHEGIGWPPPEDLSGIEKLYAKSQNHLEGLDQGSQIGRLRSGSGPKTRLVWTQSLDPNFGLNREAPLLGSSVPLSIHYEWHRQFLLSFTLSYSNLKNGTPVISLNMHTVN